MFDYHPIIKRPLSCVSLSVEDSLPLLPQDQGGWRAVLLFQGQVAAWQSTLVAHRPHMPATTSPSVGVECFTCGKTFYGFNRKFLLKRHMITHTGEKPFQCPHCPHRANLKQNLEVHIKRKHKSELPAGFMPSLSETPWNFLFLYCGKFLRVCMCCMCIHACAIKCMEFI